MSDQIREQVSAFLDGELPGTETELLLKRLLRDAQLRESFGRYALIGESLRGATHAHLTRGFAARVNVAIDGEPAVLGGALAERARAPRWWRPLAGVAVAAGVAAIAVVALQQRAVAPGIQTGTPLMAQTAAVQAGGASPGGGAPRVEEAISYTVPANSPNLTGALPAARLMNYVFAHSRYSSVLGQNNALSGLLTDEDQQEAAAVGPGAVLSPASARRPVTTDVRIAP